MPLTDYQRKRRFDRTPEPSGDRAGEPAGRAIFVVQLHHARARHYDFRLQVGDTLKSWAVPKGPSYDPAVKRLAVEVEDHPVSYADFEGDIAEGNYGAGHVDLFDRGVWACLGDPEAQWAKGHIEFELFGQRLKGTWHLVRSHRQERQPAWFLIKAKDRYAGQVEADELLDARMRRSTRDAAAKSKSARLVSTKGARLARAKAPPTPKKPAIASLTKRAAKASHSVIERIDGTFFEPELTRLRERAPSGDDWLHEVKWDGYRLLTTVADGEVKLWSRNGLRWNERLPEIAQAVQALGVASLRLDGELIALQKGHSDFNALQKTLAGEAQAPLAYMLFDLPHFAGYDISRSPLLERKALLHQLLAGAPHPLAFSSHIVGNGEEVFQKAAEQGLEGIVCKRTQSPYRGGRGDDWLKIKRIESDEFAVVGYTLPKGSRAGLGSLLLGRPAAEGGWDFAGRVGSGLGTEQLRELERQLKPHRRPTPSVHAAGIDPLLRDAHWVTPRLVVEVFFRGLGNHGLLRQPTLKALRMDKSPTALRDSDRGTPPPVTDKPIADKPLAGRSASGRKSASKRASAKPTGIDASAIVITHPDRVVYPDDGISKQAVADYYLAVMDWFLPTVLRRPTSVIRCPEGAGKPCFFQKHMLHGLHHVGSVQLKEESGRNGEYLCPGSAAAVIELVQFGALEFHPWGATAAQPELADQLVFDFDPAPEVAWPRVIAAARLARKLLQQVKLESFVRTTGGKGLHVVVPLHPACPWPQAKAFARAFADSLAQMHPLEFVAVASKAQRKDRIYIDYLRNSRGATAVASYSLRARSGAPVATPLRWEELGKLRSGADFTLSNVPTRLARLRRDPWEGFTTVRQDLQAISAEGQHPDQAR
jgi:bifunctional non-homologous end joining protein LigD